MTTLYIDADACPVKEEVYVVANRHGLPVRLVANSWMRIPEHADATLEIVSDGFDAADDWIAERAVAGDIVVTADIPLAARCLENGAQVLGTSGKPFDENSIGDALATRELMADLRLSGEMTGGPPPLTNRDRSRFLHELDKMARVAGNRQ